MEATKVRSGTHERGEVLAVRRISESGCLVNESRHDYAQESVALTGGKEDDQFIVKGPRRHDAAVR